MAKLKQRGTAWQIDTGQRGSGGRVSLGKITDAEAEAAFLAWQRGGAGDEHPASATTFAAWSVEYATWHSTEYPDSYFRIEQILRQWLIPAFGALDLAQITRQDVEHYKQRRISSGASPGTVAKELRTLQAALNKAVEWETLDRNRAKGVKPPRDVTSRPPRWYTAEELAAIYSVDPLHAATWRLLANTGMRRGEAMSLLWENVGEDAIKVVSMPEARTKSAKWRLVPITPGAKLALDELETVKRAEVLPRMTPPAISKAFRKAVRRAGIGGGVLHDLRHTFCSHLVMRGVDLRTVQVLAGHSTMRMTERYAHLSPQHLLAATAGLAL